MNDSWHEMVEHSARTNRVHSPTAMFWMWSPSPESRVLISAGGTCWEAINCWSTDLSRTICCSIPVMPCLFSGPQHWSKATVKVHPETARQITSFVFLSCFLRHFCDSDREWLTQPLKRPEPLHRDFSTTFKPRSSKAELSRLPRESTSKFLFRL